MVNYYKKKYIRGIRNTRTRRRTSSLDKSNKMKNQGKKEKKENGTRKSNHKWGGGSTSSNSPPHSPHFTPAKTSPPTDYDDDGDEWVDESPQQPDGALVAVPPHAPPSRRSFPSPMRSLRMTPSDLKRMDMIRRIVIKNGKSQVSRKSSLARSGLARHLMQKFITESQSRFPYSFNKKLTASTGIAQQKLLKDMIQSNYMPIIGEPGSGLGQFNMPNCIELDRHGNLVVVDTNNNRIQILSPFTGVCSRTIDGFRSPYSFTFKFNTRGRTDEIIVLDLNGAHIINYANGSRIKKVEFADKEMSAPTNVIYDGAIQLRFGNKMKYYSGSGGRNDPDNTVSIPGYGPMAYFTEHKFKENEPIIVADSMTGILYETGYGSVDVICDRGNGTGAGEFAGIGGIAVDCMKNVIVTDKGNNRIQIFNSDFTKIRRFGKYGSAYGEFKTPTGVAVDCHGNIFVCDSGNNRIQVIRYRPDA